MLPSLQKIVTLSSQLFVSITILIELLTTANAQYPTYIPNLINTPSVKYTASPSPLEPKGRELLTTSNAQYLTYISNLTNLPSVKYTVLPSPLEPKRRETTENNNTFVWIGVGLGLGAFLVGFLLVLKYLSTKGYCNRQNQSKQNVNSKECLPSAPLSSDHPVRHSFNEPYSYIKSPLEMTNNVPIRTKQNAKEVVAIPTLQQEYIPNYTGLTNFAATEYTAPSKVSKTRNVTDDTRLSIQLNDGSRDGEEDLYIEVLENINAKKQHSSAYEIMLVGDQP